MQSSLKIKVMNKIKIYWLAIVLLPVFTNAFAQENDTLSLDDYLEMAAQNNPEIKAAFNEYLASLEKVPQVGALPELQASLGVFVKPMAILGGNQVANIEIMQMFPWFGTLKTEKDEASVMANAKFEKFNAAKSELFYSVKSSWYQLTKLDHEIILVEENIEILKSIEKLALVKFQSAGNGSSSSEMPGKGSMTAAPGAGMSAAGNTMSGMNSAQNLPVSGNSASMQSNAGSGNMGSSNGGLEDVLRVKMEILDQQNKLASLQDQRLTIETRFNALLNRNLHSIVPVSTSLTVESLPANKLDIADSILTRNPMLAMLESEISAYNLMQLKAKKMGQPMLGVGVNYMVNQKREGNTFMMNGNDMIMPMVSVSIPIYRKKYNAMQKEASLLEEAGTQQTIDLKNKLLVEYQVFVQNLNDAERRITLSKQQEDLAQKTTDLLLSKFATSGNNYDEVLRMQYRVLDYGFNYIEAVTDYNTSVALAEKLMNALKID